MIPCGAARREDAARVRSRGARPFGRSGIGHHVWAGEVAWLAPQQDALAQGHDLDVAIGAVQSGVRGRVADVVLLAQLASDRLERIGELLEPLGRVDTGLGAQALVLGSLTDLAVGKV